MDTTDQLDQYFKDLPALASDKRALECSCELEQRTRYPLLLKMVVDHYSISSMSSEPGRCFSGAKHTVSDQRNYFEAGIIESIE